MRPLLTLKGSSVITQLQFPRGQPDCPLSVESSVSAVIFLPFPRSCLLVSLSGGKLPSWFSSWGSWWLWMEDSDTSCLAFLWKIHRNTYFQDPVYSFQKNRLREPNNWLVDYAVRGHWGRRDKLFFLFKHVFVFWQQTVRQTRKSIRLNCKTEENPWFLRKYVNSKRILNRMCLWILSLAKIKIVFKKIFQASCKPWYIAFKCVW